MTSTPVLYRSSTDKQPPSSEVLYFSPFLALTKSNSNYYTITFAHWLNDPELSVSTGDVFDKPIVESINLIGQAKSQGLFFGRGINPEPGYTLNSTINPTNGLSEPQKPRDLEAEYFIITFDRVLFFETKAEMDDDLRRNWNISTIKLEPASSFFEKLKQNRHQPNVSDYSEMINRAQ